VIPAIHPRGTRVGGLLRYLFGPGKREEHVNPRLIAAWAGAGDLAVLQPPLGANGKPDVRRLVELLEQPVRSGWNPPAKTVWHCSIRTHPTDRMLSDAQWAHIAGEVMAAVGLAPQGDAAAVRWVAVRHNADHVHLVATLVRQDLRTAWAWKDKLNAQHACRDLEERYNLYRVGPPGAGTRQWPRPAELNKAARLGGSSKHGRPEAARDRLRRQVRAVAAVASDEADFFARLTRAGVRTKLRYSSQHPGQITGYAVALDGHTTAGGEPIWYSGGKLAADLSLPRLRARWSSAGTGKPPNAARLAAQGFPPTDAYQRAADAVRNAGGALRGGADPAEASAIGAAAAALLTSLAAAHEHRGGGPLTDAADLLHRTAHEPRRPPSRHHTHAAHLRSMARLIGLMGAISNDRDAAAMLHLLYALAGLAENLADLREAQHRLHQVRTARFAAARLRAYVVPSPAADATTRRPPAAVRPGRADSARRSR